MSTATLSSAPSSVKLLAMLERVRGGTLSVKAAAADVVVATAGRTVEASTVFVPVEDRWHVPIKLAKPADRRGGRRRGAGRPVGSGRVTPFSEWEALCNIDPLTDAQAARLVELSLTLLDASTGRITGDPDECTVRLRDGRMGIRNRPERIPRDVLEGYIAWSRS